MKLRIGIEALVLLIVLFAISFFFIKYPSLDIDLHKSFYSSENGWFLKKAQPWNFLYHYGNIPAILISITSLLLFIFSYFISKFLIYRKIALFFALTMLLGPGIIVNTIFKENWGRPRPREIQEYGGKEEFLPVLTKGISGKGKSFPCGHASVGFYLFMPYFLLRKKKKILASGFFFLGLFYGGLIGAARIIQGGHFLSDVIWCFGFLYLTGLFCYHYIGLDRELLYKKKNRNAELSPFKKKILMVVSIIVAIVALSFFLLGTPYYSEKNYFPNFKNAKSKVLIINIDDGNLLIRQNQKLNLIFEAQGFGFPNSRISKKWEERYSTNGDTLIKTISFSEKGFFTELSTKFDLIIPQDSSYVYILNIKSGSIDIDSTKIFSPCINNFDNEEIISEKKIFISKPMRYRMNYR